MHSSRMCTVRSLPYRGFSLTETPLDRETPWTETPLTGDPYGQRLPPPAVDRQTPVKSLPSQTSFAGGKHISWIFLAQLQNIFSKTRESYKSKNCELFLPQKVSSLSTNALLSNMKLLVKFYVNYLHILSPTSWQICLVFSCAQLVCSIFDFRH